MDVIWMLHGCYMDVIWMLYQWEFQGPKMEVLYHIKPLKPYFGCISSYIALTQALYMIGTSD